MFALFFLLNPVCSIATLYVYHFIIALASASYEKICLLFNIGALQSQIAASQNLTSDDGLKSAAKYFQVGKYYSSWITRGVGCKRVPSMFLLLST